MLQRIFLTMAFLCAIYISSPAQATVGTLQNTAESLQGYTFFSPFSGTKAYMVDNCGRLVNEWSRGTRPGLAAYFLDNGLMLRTYKPSLVGPFTSASNAGGLELVNWEDEVVWSYEFNTATWLSHHDAKYMPNGHILVLSWELVYEEELIALGRDPDRIASQGYMWSERIIEVEPVGENDMNIIWEWRIKDHYVQDFDPTKANYGVVAEHPERFDINLPELNSSNSNSSWDWNHFNAIDYNEDLDQVLISVRNSDEVWIIDHSTTTEEAATSSGGLSDKGGDILYRWGNPSAYDRGPVSDQQLFGQHGTHWIPQGFPDAGKIMIYNNGNGRPGPDFSTVELISPPVDADGHYLVPAAESFGPVSSEIVYGDEPGETFYSAYMSNAQRLANGNTLICAGSPGRVFEVNPERDMVWEYLVPLFADSPATQGQNVSNNAIFRSYRFSPDFSGFDGIDFTASATIELGDSPVNCELFVATEAPPTPTGIQMHYQAPERKVYFDNPAALPVEVTVADILGRVWSRTSNRQSTFSLSLPLPLAGIVFVYWQVPGSTRHTERIWIPKY